MAKKKSNKKWYALSASIIAAVMLFIFVGLPTLGYQIQLPSFSGWGSNGSDQPNIDADPSGPEYTTYWLDLKISPSDICVGERTTASITSNMPNAMCAVFTNTGSGWNFFGNAILDSAGRYTQSSNVNVMGTAMFRATCADTNGNYRISNVATLTVTDCDSDGDGFPNSEEIEEGTDPFDPDDFPGGPGSICNCEDVVIPTDVGDKGGYCAEYGSCTIGNCDNYYDSASGLHKCACTDTWFCQAYYEYFYTTDCDCPPGTELVMVTKSSFMCMEIEY